MVVCNFFRIFAAESFILNRKNMAKVFQFMANGFEDIEALIPVDVLRRGGVDIKTVSIYDTKIVESAHGVQMVTDLTFEEAEPMLKDADLLMLPGGMPGATNLNEHEGLKKALVAQAEAGKMVSAICAAPLVLGGLGILKGKRATCYPGFEQTLEGAEYTEDLWTIDGNIITGEGPAAALPYAYSLLALLVSEEAAREVAEGMRYIHLMEARML
jgi:4-methyl-5(b-hydroxyethyl)-thiazole monophosphate biosynthesis